MKKLIVSLLSLAALSFGQTNTLSQATLTSAMDNVQNYALVSSATGLAAGRVIYIDLEMMNIQSTYNGSALRVPVTRTGELKTGHINGSAVIGGRANWFQKYDAFGSCTLANTFVSPWVNQITGNQSLCGAAGLWGAGFGNTSRPAVATAAVASAAGLVTPSGPLFHITGALAITGFNVPVGLVSGGGFCVVPDGAFTTTTANNIALASTAVVSKTLCYTYEKAAAKPFFPSY